jgi:hypothetical protein
VPADAIADLAAGPWRCRPWCPIRRDADPGIEPLVGIGSAAPRGLHLEAGQRFRASNLHGGCQRPVGVRALPAAAAKRPGPGSGAAFRHRRGHGAASRRPARQPRLLGDLPIRAVSRVGRCWTIHCRSAAYGCRAAPRREPEDHPSAIRVTDGSTRAAPEPAVLSGETRRPTGMTALTGVTAKPAARELPRRHGDARPGAPFARARTTARSPPGGETARVRRPACSAGRTRAGGRPAPATTRPPGGPGSSAGRSARSARAAPRPSPRASPRP